MKNVTELLDFLQKKQTNLFLEGNCLCVGSYSWDDVDSKSGFWFAYDLRIDGSNYFFFTRPSFLRGPSMWPGIVDKNNLSIYYNNYSTEAFLLGPEVEGLEVLINSSNIKQLSSIIGSNAPEFIKLRSVELEPWRINSIMNKGNLTLFAKSVRLVVKFDHPLSKMGKFKLHIR